MSTVSTVFSSPCWRKFTDAVCRKRPKRCLKEVVYWYRGSVASVRQNPDQTLSTEAIISGISSLLSVFQPCRDRCNIKAYRISLVKAADERSLAVIFPFTKVGIPEKALRTKLRCLADKSFLSCSSRLSDTIQHTGKIHCATLHLERYLVRRIKIRVYWNRPSLPGTTRLSKMDSVGSTISSKIRIAKPISSLFGTCHDNCWWCINFCKQVMNLATNHNFSRLVQFAPMTMMIRVKFCTSEFRLWSRSSPGIDLRYSTLQDWQTYSPMDKYGLALATHCKALFHSRNILASKMFCREATAEALTTHPCISKPTQKLLC